jgi:osmotically-inducible protein OsmY
MVGVVSRSDILRAFARADAAIIDEIETRVMGEVLWIDHKMVRITCEDGNVTLVGELDTKTDTTLLAELTKRLDGVVSVDNLLTWKVENTKLQLVPPPPGRSL